MTEVTDPRAATRAAIRRASLQLFIAVAVLHGTAITVFYLAHIERAAPRTRMYFTGAWLIATVLVVAPMLKRVRKARFA